MSVNKPSHLPLWAIQIKSIEFQNRTACESRWRDSWEEGNYVCSRSKMRGGDEYELNTSWTCVKMSLWNPLVYIIVCTNKKKATKKKAIWDSPLGTIAELEYKCEEAGRFRMLFDYKGRSPNSNGRKLVPAYRIQEDVGWSQEFSFGVIKLCDF